MTVLTILSACLRSGHWDGLYRKGCGCTLDDLAPCDGIQQDCTPGIRRICGCGEPFVGPASQQKCEECDDK